MYAMRLALVTRLISVSLITLALQPTLTQVEQVVSAEPQQAVPLAPFTSVELDSGVKAVLHYGSPQRVTLLKWSGDVSLITVTQERLVIDKCRDKCPRGYELQVEIVTPLITSISVANGGVIESRGNFPLHTAISLAVRHGGTVDARAILANDVTAAVYQGGTILAKPQTTMVASVSHGGEITYWGAPQVTSSTQHGGVVTKGAAADEGKPLSDFDSSRLAPPAIPKVPSTRHKNRM